MHIHHSNFFVNEHIDGLSEPTEETAHLASSRPEGVLQVAASSVQSLAQLWLRGTAPRGFHPIHPPVKWGTREEGRKETI